MRPQPQSSWEWVFKAAEAKRVCHGGLMKLYITKCHPYTYDMERKRA